MENIKELLPIERNEEGTQIVSGRDLYNWLGVKDHFTEWMKRMVEYGFAENVDFAVIQKNLKDETGFGGHRKIKDYAMTIDMAKEIAMIQRTERGKQARQYFIESEKQLQQIQAQTQLPTTPQQMTAAILENMKANNDDIQEIRSDVDELKNTMRVDKGQEIQLLKQHHESAFEALGGKESNAYADRKLRDRVFRLAWHDFKEYFYLPRYAELPKVKFDNGIEFLKAWQPDTGLRIEIKETNGQGTLL